MSSSKSSLVVTTIAFAAGVVAATILHKLAKKDDKDEKKKTGTEKQNAGAIREDHDLSMYYSSDIKSLKQTPQHRKFLPADFYGQMVRDCVVCCVDCLIVRRNPSSGKQEALLVERAAEPVKGVWWLPGGRLYKGETFFEGALRKTKDETGLDGGKAVQVLGFYNTMFPTSSWDTAEEQGTQTVQPIVLVTLPDDAGEIALDDTSELSRWIPLSPQVARANKEDAYVIEALDRLEAWNATFGSSVLASP